MMLQNPQQLLDKVDFAEYDKMREHSPWTSSLPQPTYSEPCPDVSAATQLDNKPTSTATSTSSDKSASLPDLIEGHVQRFGDSIDTDSIAPTEICISTDPEKLKRGAFCLTKPTFYDLAQAGATIIVAENAFGTGSSREQAPKVLLAAGIQAVVAKSFAFIYGRNQANCGLLGIKMKDEKFYELAREGVNMSIDMRRRTISCCGEEFRFELDPIEEKLLATGGLLNIYTLYGTTLFRKLQDAPTAQVDKERRMPETVERERDSKLEW